MLDEIKTTIIVKKQLTNNPELTVCIPTNGISELVFPNLDAIYQQDVDEILFEVVLMDNGNNDSFKEKATKYAQAHKNIIYAQTNAHEFLSETEAYKLSSGKLIKFWNHRAIVEKQGLQHLIDFASKYWKEKPVVYFSNDLLKQKETVRTAKDFDDFLTLLGYWTTCSSGIGFWKDDLSKINLSNPNALFPHTSILFARTQAKMYIIDNTLISREMPLSQTQKGKYNLFNAFSVEFIVLILNLYRTGAISSNSFNSVKNSVFNYVCILYYNFIFRKRKCSFDLSNYKDSISIFYRLKSVKRRCVGLLFKSVITFFPRRLKRKLPNVSANQNA